jgi:hypothetical protein
MLWTLLLACTSSDADPAAPTGDSATAAHEVPWSHGLPSIAPLVRTITHLHSPFSHDACDGEGLLEGAVNQPCLDDFRAGLCNAGIDVAFVTDHPDYAGDQDYADLHHARPGDDTRADRNGILCDDGHTVYTFPGFEDELMPIGLEQHVPGDVAARKELLNRSDGDALQAMVDAGAHVFMAHTEGKELASLEVLQDAGLTGIEIFNLHAMFAPDIRQEDLGLDGLGWFSDIAPFTSPDATAEPDLFVLGVLQLQPPSLAAFDALLARGPVTGIIGTDAHQNVLNVDLADGQRADSYQRMLRWMSNHVQVEAGEEVKDALAAGRSTVVFEILGTPAGFGFSAPDAPMGGSSTARTLTIDCPQLHPESPKGLDAPEITARLMRDGVAVHTGCGEVPIDGPGVYRVEVDIVPNHLRPFLGDDPEPWIHSWPWMLSNGIRVQ